jgi:hypothetical protein
VPSAKPFVGLASLVLDCIQFLLPLIELMVGHLWLSVTHLIVQTRDPFTVAIPIISLLNGLER